MSASGPATFVGRVFKFLGLLLAFVVALMLCVPAVLLPPATSVPAWAWIPLINADLALLVLFFRVLDAPHKQIVWFEHSGHKPWVSESDRFVEAMVDTVLAQTQGRG